ncbi:MAG: TlpA family protein disulfide reductase [Cystobacterineae bacterium]|nr:TlpA family protein disulfide reductase [Cystobacterineae bacterium]
MRPNKPPTPPKFEKQTLWVAIAAFIVLAASGTLVFAMRKGFGKNPREVPFKLLGQSAPAFSMPTLEGGQRTLEEFRGRPLVINFWSSWCGPCAEEAAVLEMAYKKWGKHVAFLGVVFEDSEAKARNFLRQFPASYPQLFSPISTMAIDYAVTGVPETYFIDKQGTIVAKHAAPIWELRQFDVLLQQAFSKEELRQEAPTPPPAPPQGAP